MTLNPDRGKAGVVTQQSVGENEVGVGLALWVISRRADRSAGSGLLQAGINTVAVTHQ